MKLDMMANVTLPPYPFLCSMTKVVPVSKINWISDEPNHLVYIGEIVSGLLVVSLFNSNIEKSPR